MSPATGNGKSSDPPKNGTSSSRPKITSALPAAGASLARKRRPLRKEEIIVEATRLFAERGYEGASMGDLAERVGLRKASLFHHFPSKDVLYSMVIAQLVESVKAAILEASRAEGSFAERLEILTDVVTETLGAKPHAARLLVREAMDGGPVMKDGLGVTINEALSGALELAKAGQRAGEFNPGLDATQIIVSLIGIHFMPFAVGEIVERFTGTSPFHEAFLEQRKAAVRAQVRDLLLVTKK